MELDGDLQKLCFGKRVTSVFSMFSSVGHTKYLSCRVNISTKNLVCKTQITHTMRVIFVLHIIDDCGSPKVVYKWCEIELFRTIPLEDHSRDATVIPLF